MIYLLLVVGALLLIVLALWGAGAMDSILKEDKRQ